ncbi:hypothetical protein [Microbacterium sp. PMB16]|uniref:hypothetical protein n=1 Tax=Microbacterium sp. PMB16 TaxID=3120157 RepID=UPI003F4B0874
MVLIGTAIALYQFWRTQDDSAVETELGVVRAFARAPRRVRALVIALVSRAIAVPATIALIGAIAADPVFDGIFTTGRAPFIMSVQAGTAAFFLVVDWWSFRQGDEFPRMGTFFVGGTILAGALGYALYRGVSEASWPAGLIWTGVAIAWFKSVDWAVDSSAGLARAVQRG